MLKKFALTAAVIVLLVGFLVGTKYLQINAMIVAGASMTVPPETVTSAEVREETWEDIINATGSLSAVQGVTVAAEMPGKVVRIGFESGADVKAGDFLVQLDATNEEAQLRAAESSLRLAQIGADRSRELLQKKTIAQAEFDPIEAQLAQAQAQAEALRATIAKKTVRAPFAGRLGIRQVNLGQILREGDPVATLQTLDPIYANFSIPQQRLGALTAGLPVRLTSDAIAGKSYEGKINAINSEVDTATRNVWVQGLFANPEGKLRAGMFASITVVLPTNNKVISIPATAVIYAPYGDSVFVIDEKKNEQTGKVEKVLRQQFVRLGASRGDFVSVVGGLKPGESVVSSGVFKLRPGMSVTIDNKLAPEPKLAPTPKDA